MRHSERHTCTLPKSVRLVELSDASGVGAGENYRPNPNLTASYLEGELIATPEFATLVSAISDHPLPASLHFFIFIQNILTLCNADQQNYALETTTTFLKEANGGAPRGSG